MNIRGIISTIRRMSRTGQLGEFYRYTLAEKISRWIYPKYKFSEWGRIFLEDQEFIDYYEKFEGTAHYHSLDRKYTLDQLLNLISAVPGDTVECGAFQGASSYLICSKINGSDRKHHVFDSFEGLSTPNEKDGEFWEESSLSTPEEIIKKNLSEFSFVNYYKGWIPERFSEVADRKFCFVHIDVDLFDPTRDSIEFFYPKMSPGSIILCDDYGFDSCPGSKLAMDEFFETKPENIVSLPSGQAFVIIGSGDS